MFEVRGMFLEHARRAWRRLSLLLRKERRVNAAEVAHDDGVRLVCPAARHPQGTLMRCVDASDLADPINGRAARTQM
jgi:hypothetical protein